MAYENFINHSNGQSGEKNGNGNGNGKPRILVAVQQADLAELVQRTLGEEGYETARIEHGEEAYTQAVRQLPNLAIIDTALPGLDGYALVRRLHDNLTTHNLPILILTSSGEVADKISGFQVGNDDYLAKPVQPPELKYRVKSLLARNQGPLGQEATRAGKIIASFGTKGGVGKTMLAVNLAVALARRTHDQVVLFDADFFFGEVALHFNLTPKLTILNLLDHIHELDEYLVNQVLMMHSSGVRVLLSPVAPEQAERITPRDVDRLLDFLSQHNDYVVVDCTPSYGERNLTILEKADVIYLLVTPDVGSLKNMGIFFNLMFRLGLPNSRVHIVLNRADSKSGIEAAEIEKSFKRKVEFRIPSGGYPVTLSVNRGEPLVLLNPNHPFSQQVYKMADSLPTLLRKQK